MKLLLVNALDPRSNSRPAAAVTTSLNPESALCLSSYNTIKFAVWDAAPVWPSSAPRITQKERSGRSFHSIRTRPRQEDFCLLIQPPLAVEKETV
jgi:hypothetical protein